jgi:hypothetical protein
MPTRSSSAQWSGNLARGSGTMSLGSGALKAEKTCPVSRALGAIEIGLDAKLA